MGERGTFLWSRDKNGFVKVGVMMFDELQEKQNRDLKIIDLIKKHPYLDAKVKTIANDLSFKIKKYGSLTESQSQLLLNIANENNIMLTYVPGNFLCKECHNYGVITANRDGMLFAFQCECQWGPIKFGGIPKMDKTDYRDYQINPPAEFVTLTDEGKVKSVLSDEERKDIFNFMQGCIQGRYSKDEVNLYCEMLERALRSKGVEVRPWRDL